MDEVIDFINDNPKPLAVYYYGAQKNADSNRLRDETSSGAYCTNDCIVQAISHYTGFGGVGESGSGRYGGLEGFRSFSNRKGALIK
jgi:acyl-CoA reductase-like NAD-dependent aldehyde dehydrogenase